MKILVGKNRRRKEETAQPQPADTGPLRQQPSLKNSGEIDFFNDGGSNTCGDENHNVELSISGCRRHHS